MKRLFGEQMTLKADAWTWYGAFALLYLLLAIILPPNTAIIQTYNLSASEYHVLMVLVGLPMVAVWFAAFYGYIRLAHYARRIHGHREGKAFAYLARGVKWLAWGLPASANLNVLLGGIAHSASGFLPTAIIVSHYAFLVIAVVAFTAMANGARELADIHGRLPSKAFIRSILIGLVGLSAAFTYVTTHSVTRHTNPYHLPMWLILLTIVIPYLYAWMMGLIAALQIGAYRRSVSGLLYQRALSMLASGTIIAIVAAIIFQYVTVSSVYLRRIHLNGSLLLLYVVLAGYAVGFILMARGAESLRKIEEV